MVRAITPPPPPPLLAAGRIPLSCTEYIPPESPAAGNDKLATSPVEEIRDLP